MSQGYFVAQARRTRQEIRGGQKMRYAPWVDWNLHVTGTGYRRYSRRKEWEYVEGEEGLSQVWKAGDHVSLFARTDWGKTHFVLKGLAPLWPDDYPWLCIDCKGDDPMLQGFGRRVGKLPPRLVREKFHEDQRYRIVVPYSVEQIPQAQATVRDAMRTARREKGWIIHLNEARALTDPKAPGLGLSGQVQAYWRMGRPHVTMIAETQAPRWVPTDMYDQPSHIYIGGNLDERARRRLGEIGGDTDNIWRSVSLLGEHEFLYVRSLDGMMQIVKAPA